MGRRRGGTRIPLILKVLASPHDLINNPLRLFTMFFPLELFYMVISLLADDLASLTRLRLACRLFDEIIQPIVFSCIVFENHGNRRDERVIAFYGLLHSRPALGRHIRRIRISTCSAFMSKDHLHWIFAQISKTVNRLDHGIEVSFESERRFEAMRGSYVRDVVLPIASHVVSLHLSNVRLEDHSFISLFPCVKTLSLVGVEGVRVHPFYEFPDQSIMPSPTFLRYAEKPPAIRRIWDEGDNYFHDHARMTSPTAKRHIIHPDPLISRCSWSALQTLHFETGFVRDVLLFGHVLPSAASSLESLTVELTGLRSAYSALGTPLTLLTVLFFSLVKFYITRTLDRPLGHSS
jgi:hypothetical protein